MRFLPDLGGSARWLYRLPDAQPRVRPVSRIVRRARAPGAEYAREILRLAGKENVPVTSASENTALRPRFTLLDNMMLRITGLYQMPDWHDALSEYMSHRQTGVNK